MLTTTSKAAHHSAASIVRGILEPLCAETAKLLRPTQFSPHDRLRVELSEDGRSFVVQPYASVPLPDGTVKHVEASFSALRTWVLNVPQRKDLKSNRWELAATDVTALVIDANWEDSRIDWEPEAKTTYEFLLARFLSQTIQSQHRAAFKVNGVLPQEPAEWMETASKPLSKHQRVSAITSLGQEGYGEFSEQGTGKTPTMIARMCVEARRLKTKLEKRGEKPRLFRVLVVCPKNVRTNWEREIASFATVAGKATVLRGGQYKRFKAIVETIRHDGDDCEFGAVIASYETVKRSWDHVRAIPWDLVIADEAHYMKGSNTDRTKVLTQLREISSMRVVMTGTPVCNTVLDLYALLEFLGEGMSGFTTREAFKEFYCQYEKGRFRDKVTGYQNMPFLQERLARISFRTTKKEAMPDMPEKNYDIREVTMTSRQTEIYNKLLNQLRLEIEEAEGKNSITADNILTKLLRLAQVTSGILAWDAELDPDTGDSLRDRRVEYLMPNPKLDELVDCMREMGDDEKCIIWTCFTPDVKEIHKRLEAEGFRGGTYYGGTSEKDREQVVADFNGKHARDFKYIVGNAGAGGTGLNLRGYDPDAAEDHGCNCARVFYYSQDWSMVKRNQSEDRAHRRGTRVPVQYTDLVVSGTIDETIRERVMMKTLRSLEVQDVRKILAAVLNSVPELED
jgi:SNF2 family DNA or RNA helicase